MQTDKICSINEQKQNGLTIFFVLELGNLGHIVKVHHFCKKLFSFFFKADIQVHVINVLV